MVSAEEHAPGRHVERQQPGRHRGRRLGGIGGWRRGGHGEDYEEEDWSEHGPPRGKGDLSTGQRKRLAPIQAWLEGRPVLVLDEWAADQDPAFRQIFYTRLLPDLKRLGRTLVVISHDDRYFHIADRVLRLEHGRIVEPQPLTCEVPASPGSKVERRPRATKGQRRGQQAPV